MLACALLLALPSTAQITTLSDWNNVYHGTSTSTQTATVSVPAGSDTYRVMVVAIATSRTNSGTRSASVSYGGQALTLANGDLGVSKAQHTALYYLPESGLDAATNSTLSFSVSNGTTYRTMVWAAVFDGVDQSNPVTDSQNYNSGTSSVSSGIAFSPALSVGAADLALEVINCTRTGSTTLRTINYATNWSMQDQQTQTGSSTAMRAAVVNRSVPASDITDASTTTFSGTALASMTGMVLKAAPLEVFRSRQSGAWNDSNTWEQQYPGGSWQNTANVPVSLDPTLVPTYPEVAGTASSQKTTNTGSTHTVSLPNGIQAGDLLLVFWTDANTVSTAVTIPSGWTALYNTVWPSSNVRIVAMYRVATGSEGTTLSVSAGAEKSAHTAYRIAAGSYQGVPAASSLASATSQFPDPPSLTSGFGNTPTLWIAAAHVTGAASITGPSNYSSLVSGYSGATGTADSRTATAIRELSAASENPGTFTLDASRSWGAFTVAVRSAEPASYSTATVRNTHLVTVSAAQTADHVTVENGGTLKVNNGINLGVAVGAALTVANGGTLEMAGTAILGGAGDLSLANGATLRIGSPAGISASGATGNIQVTGTRGYGTAANFIYNGTAAQSTGNGLTQAANVTIDNGSGVTLGSALSASGAITVTSGALILGAPNLIGDATAIVLNGGTLRTGATTGFSDQVGTLTLAANSTIALGSDDHTLTFANSSANDWDGTSLTITGWTGTVGNSGTAGKIVVGTGGLSVAQRATISFDGFPGAASILPSGELVPSAPADLAVTAGATNHGSSCVGVPATTVQYTLTNTGGIAAGVEVSSNNTEFAVTGAPTEVAGSGGTAQFDVTFTPSATGARNATITITWDGHATPVTLSLTGSGFTTNDAATISYTGSPYCTSDGTATVGHTGTGGGTYASTTGLSIDASTGAIDPGASTPGSYTVTYTFSSCLLETTASVTIEQATLWYEDADEDGFGDPNVSMWACDQPAGYVANNTDQCPEDGDKTEPGICGCGTGDEDSDGDGVVDCEDGCPADPFKTEPGFCGCGAVDDDTDGNGIPDCLSDDVERLYLRSTQTNTGTGTFVRDLLEVQGSAVSVTSSGTTSTSYSERLSFTIDHGILTQPVGVGAFLASVNVSGVSSSDARYRLRVMRLNAAGVEQDASDPSQEFSGNGIRIAPLLMPVSEWSASDRLVLSIEVRRATSGSTNLTITVATGNTNSWLGYVPTKPMDEFRSRQSGPWNSVDSWEQRFDNGSWVTATSAPSSLDSYTLSSFPQVAGNNSSASTSNVSNHNVALPAGIAEGDLLLVFWADRDNSSTVTIPSGWTELYNTVTSNYRRLAMYRVADGSEGSSLSVTTSSSERSAHTSYRIAAGSYDGVPVAGNVATGSSSSPNPPSLTSGFGEVPTLWIAASHSQGNSSSSPPSGYSNIIAGYTGSTGSSHARMATATRALAAATEDPGNFALGTSRTWGANTVAIRGVSVEVSPKSTTTVRNGHQVTVSANQAADNLEVEAGGTLVLTDERLLTLRGTTVKLDGTVTPNKGEIMLEGSDPVNLSTTGTVSLYNLTVNTPAGTSAQGAINILGTLELAAGSFNAAQANVKLVSNAHGTGRLGTVHPGASYAGDLTAERYIPGGVTNWRLLGSPVAGRTVLDWKDDFLMAGFPGSHHPNFRSGGVLWPSVRWYNETVTGASALDGLVGVSGTGHALTPGRGFAVWSGDAMGGTQPFTVDVTGPPTVAQAPFQLPVTWTNTGTPAVDGFNLVSNPLPSPIAFSEIARGADVQNFYWIYDPTRGNNATWNGTVGTNGANGVIQSSQGFWLKATGPNVTTTVDENAKTSGNGGGLFGGALQEQAPLPMLRLTVSSGINTYKDETVVVFQDGTPDFEAGDVAKFVFNHPSAPQIGTRSADQVELAINMYGKPSTDVSIPVMVKVAVNGTYKVTASDMEHIGAMSCVVLEDLVTGTRKTLTDGASHTFSISTTANANVPRFMLHVSAPIEAVPTDATCAYAADGAAMVTIPGSTAMNVTWKDNMGNTLLHQPGITGQTSIQNLAAGRYSVAIGAAAGCPARQSVFEVREPYALEADIVVTRPTCSTAQDGVLELHVLGGTGTYAYLWTNGGTTATIQVGAGQYGFTVTDANGCEKSGTYNLTVPPGAPPCQASCTENLTIEVGTDANGTQTTWEVVQLGTNNVLCNGGGWYPPNAVITENCCLPEGCYALRVYDSGGDGILNGGYALRTSDDHRRIIDNLGNFRTGALSAIANNEGFCLPLGADRPIHSGCDKTWWRSREFFVAAENPAVSAKWVPGGANAVQSANSGYEFWWYDPNGGYSFRKFRPHNVSDGFANVGAVRACHVQLNNWASANHIPDGRPLNVKVRGVVDGTPMNWGPACRFTLDEQLSACPPTKLIDTPGDANFSCGVTRSLQAGQRVYARPVRGASAYQWRFRIPAEEPNIQPIVATTTTYILNLNSAPVSGLKYGKQYQVEVRASKDGGATWCNNDAVWGEVCILDVQAPGTGDDHLSFEQEAAKPRLALWPNPNSGEQVWLNLDMIDPNTRTAVVDIFDMTGKRISTRAFTIEAGTIHTMIDLHGDISSGPPSKGMYLVHVTAGDKVYTERLVVQ